MNQPKLNVGWRYPKKRGSGSVLVMSAGSCVDGWTILHWYTVQDSDGTCYDQWERVLIVKLDVAGGADA